MEEDVISLLEAVHPGETKKFPEIDSLVLTWKYLPALPPNPKNIRIFYRLLKKRELNEPKASLCLVHGFAEHSGKFINAAIHFALLDYEVHMIDMRHLGYSGGARAGHNLFEIQKDINLLLQQPRPDLPCFLWGHSMGGLIVSTILINNPKLNITGAIVSAPLFRSSNAELSSTMESIMKLVAPVMRQGVFNSYICPSCCSRDDIYLKNVFEDKKMMPLLSSDMGISMLDHMKVVIPQAKKMIHPIVFFHGNNDALTSMSSTQSVYTNCGSKDKTMVILEGTYHEPHHDVDRDEYLKKVSDWVEKRYKLGIPLGVVPNLIIGVAGLKTPCMSRTKKIIISLFVLSYLGIA